MILNKLNDVLKAREISRARLARETKLSINTIFLMCNNITKGIEYETLDKICNYLECEVSDILAKE